MALVYQNMEYGVQRIQKKQQQTCEEQNSDKFLKCKLRLGVKDGWSKIVSCVCRAEPRPRLGD